MPDRYIVHRPSQAFQQSGMTTWIICSAAPTAAAVAVCSSVRGGRKKEIRGYHNPREAHGGLRTRARRVRLVSRLVSRNRTAGASRNRTAGAQRIARSYLSTCSETNKNRQNAWVGWGLVGKDASNLAQAQACS